MKSIQFFITTLFLLVTTISYSQSSSLGKGKKVKHGYIFLELDQNDKLRHFSNYDHPESTKVLKSTTYDLVDDNSCNIYIKWLNPIRYKFLWKDTVYVDERDKVISDYLNLLSSQLPKLENNAIPKGGLGVKNLVRCTRDTLHFQPQNYEFNDIYLNQVISETMCTITKTDSAKIKQLLDNLFELDKKNKIDQKSALNKIFDELFKLKHPDETFNYIIEEQYKDINKIRETYKVIDSLQKEIKNEINKLDLVDDINFREILIKSYVREFINRTEIKLKSDKELTDKLQPIIDLFKKSTLTPSPHLTEYFLVKTIDFEDSKYFETSVTLTEYEMKEKKDELKEMVKKSELANFKLTFRRFDPISVSVGSGVFYSNIMETQFGVANGAGEEFVVTSESIKRDRYGAAAFLNFQLDWGSRYLSPLFQIGIDPTKKRPFLLLGAGFIIPSSNFSITGGPIWTWNPTLTTLKVGDSIPSTIDLEKDIKYEFDPKPKGWHLGVQYNF